MLAQPHMLPTKNKKYVLHLKALKKQLPGAIRLQFAGDLVRVSCDKPELTGLLRRYESLFEYFANLEKPLRILNYKLFNALMLTSYAKKAKEQVEKHQLFEMKNKIFLSLVQNYDYRKLLSFRYLTSSNILVKHYCSRCQSENAKNQLPRYQWKHCSACSLNRNFYDVVCMHHKLPQGYAQIFLSHDRMHLLPFKPKFTGLLNDTKEGAVFAQYQLGLKHLSAIAYESVLAMYQRFGER